MQAVILAAGKSSRFYPFSKKHHKSLFLLMGKPIIQYTLEAVKKAGIKDIILVVHDEEDFRRVLGSGEKVGVDLTYCIQPEALGMGDALLRAKDLIQDDFFLLSGHRLDFYEYADRMLQKKTESDVVVLTQETGDVSKYGEVVLEGDRVVSITEKPDKSDDKQGYRLLSTYLLNKDFLRQLEAIPTSQYHFERALSEYSKDHITQAVQVEEYCFSLKYPWDLLDIKNFVLKDIRQKISPTAQIADSAKILGEVVIEDGAKVMENSVIKGPCYIGKNAVVGDFVLIRDNSILEDNVVVGVFSEVKNALIQRDTHIHSGYIGDSVIGHTCRIGGGVSTSNRRLDRQVIYSQINDEKVSTGKKSLGVMIGDECHTGSDVSFMPGIIVGSNSVVGPSTTIMKNIEDDMLVYTEFSHVTKKKNNG